MGGQSSSQTQQIPPRIQEGMNNLPPDVVAQLQATQPIYLKDPRALIQSGMENLPPDVVDMMKRLAGPMNANNAPKRR